MIEDPNSTYLEDFLQSLENLPYNFRRECELVKPVYFSWCVQLWSQLFVAIYIDKRLRSGSAGAEQGTTAD